MSGFGLLAFRFRRRGSSWSIGLPAPFGPGGCIGFSFFEIAFCKEEFWGALLVAAYKNQPMWQQIASRRMLQFFSVLG